MNTPGGCLGKGEEEMDKQGITGDHREEREKKLYFSISGGY